MTNATRWALPENDLIIAGLFAAMILLMPALATAMSSAMILNWLLLDFSFFADGVWRAAISLVIAPGLIGALWLYCRDPYGPGYEHTLIIILQSCALGVPLGAIGWTLRQVLRLAGI